MVSPSHRRKYQVLHRLRTANAEATVAFGHIHQEETGVTSGIVKKRLSPIVEENEVTGVFSSAAAAIRAFFFPARRRAVPADPAKVPSASGERGYGEDEDEGVDWDLGEVVGEEGPGKKEDAEEGTEVEASSVAESVALPAISQAFRAAPAAPVELSSASIERGHDKKEGRKQEEEGEEERVAGVEDIPKEREDEDARESSVPASVALPAMSQAFPAVPAAATELPSASIKQGNGNDGRGEEGREKQEAKEAEENEVVGAEVMEMERKEKAKEVEKKKASSAAVVGARASIVRASTSVDYAAAASVASVASAAGASSASIQRENQENGEKEVDREREEEGKVGKSTGDASVANPGHDKVQYGSPVPAEFRPEGHEDDALCSWSFDCFDKKAGQRLLGSGAFGTSFVWRAMLAVTDFRLQCDHASWQVVFAPLIFSSVDWLCERLTISRCGRG